MFAVVAGVIVTYEPAQMHTVWPSGGAASVAWLAITPPPPGRLSTIVGCFQSVARLSASTRPRTSPVLPALAPVTKRTGFEGKSAAWAVVSTKARRARIFRMARILICAAHERGMRDERDRGAGEHHHRHRQRPVVADPADRGARQHAERRLRRAEQRRGDAGALGEGRHRHRGGVRGDEADGADHEEDRDEDAGEAERVRRRENEEERRAGGEGIHAPA